MPKKNEIMSVSFGPDKDKQINIKTLNEQYEAFRTLMESHRDEFQSEADRAALDVVMNDLKEEMEQINDAEKKQQPVERKLALKMRATIHSALRLRQLQLDYTRVDLKKLDEEFSICRNFSISIRKPFGIAATVDYNKYRTCAEFLQKFIADLKNIEENPETDEDKNRIRKSEKAYQLCNQLHSYDAIRQKWVDNLDDYFDQVHKMEYENIQHNLQKEKIDSLYKYLDQFRANELHSDEIYKIESLLPDHFAKEMEKNRGLYAGKEPGQLNLEKLNGDFAAFLEMMENKRNTIEKESEQKIFNGLIDTMKKDMSAMNAAAEKNQQISNDLAIDMDRAINASVALAALHMNPDLRALKSLQEENAVITEISTDLRNAFDFNSKLNPCMSLKSIEQVVSLIEDLEQPDHDLATEYDITLKLVKATQQWSIDRNLYCDFLKKNFNDFDRSAHDKITAGFKSVDEIREYFFGIDDIVNMRSLYPKSLHDREKTIVLGNGKEQLDNDVLRNLYNDWKSSFISRIKTYNEKDQKLANYLLEKADFYMDKMDESKFIRGKDAKKLHYILDAVNCLDTLNMGPEKKPTSSDEKLVDLTKRIDSLSDIHDLDYERSRSWEFSIPINSKERNPSLNRDGNLLRNGNTDLMFENLYYWANNRTQQQQILDMDLVNLGYQGYDIAHHTQLTDKIKKAYKDRSQKIAKELLPETFKKLEFDLKNQLERERQREELRKWEEEQRKLEEERKEEAEERRKREEERKKEEEERRKREKEQAEARKKREEEEKARKKQEEEAEARRKQEEEAEARRKEEEERKKEEEWSRKQAEEKNDDQLPEENDLEEDNQIHEENNFYKNIKDLRSLNEYLQGMEVKFQKNAGDLTKEDLAELYVLNDLKKQSQNGQLTEDPDQEMLQIQISSLSESKAFSAAVSTLHNHGFKYKATLQQFADLYDFISDKFDDWLILSKASKDEKTEAARRLQNSLNKISSKERKILESVDLNNDKGDFVTNAKSQFYHMANKEIARVLPSEKKIEIADGMRISQENMNNIDDDNSISQENTNNIDDDSYIDQENTNNIADGMHNTQGDIKNIDEPEPEKEERVIAPAKEQDQVNASDHLKKEGRVIAESENYTKGLANLWKASGHATSTFGNSKQWNNFCNSLEITTYLALKTRGMGLEQKKAAKVNQAVNPDNAVIPGSATRFSTLDRKVREYINAYCNKKDVQYVANDEISYDSLCEILGYSAAETKACAKKYEAYKLADHVLPGEKKTKEKGKSLNSDDTRKLHIVETFMSKKESKLEQAEKALQAHKEGKDKIIDIR